MPKKKCINNFKELKKIFLQKEFPFDEPIRYEACLVNRPVNLNEIVLGNENIFLIGEAAGFVSPSSLEGISYAMDSATILSDILNTDKNSKNIQESYRKACLGLKIKILAKIAKTPFIFNPKIRYLVMKSGLASLKIRTSSI